MPCTSRPPVNRVRCPHGNWPTCRLSHTWHMSRERWALDAMALLFGLAATPALLLRGAEGQGAGPARHATAAAFASGRSVDVLSAVPPSPQCLNAGIPIFSGATPAPQLAIDRRVATAIDELRLAPT